MSAERNLPTSETAREMVRITKEEHERLLKAEAFLDALFSVGVDNWSGYDEAQDIFSEWEEQQ